MLAGPGHLCYGCVMKVLHLLTVGAAAAAMLLAASGADAQQRPIGGGPRNWIPSNGGGMQGMHGIHGRRGFHDRGGFFVPLFWDDRDDPVIIEKTVVKEVPVAAEPKPPEPPKREPYAIGKSYASLPGGCMKLIEGGGSYYLCSGEWYQEVSSGGAVKYKAVAKP